jgi:ATP-dependent DNA helicase RecG
MTPENFEPLPKNPILSRFFVNIGYADTLGSGVRNLFKFSKMYSGADPEMIEGDVFKTIIPLPQINATQDATETETENATVNLVNATGNLYNATVNATENKILEAILQNESVSYDELAEILSKNRATIYRNIKSLKGRGLLERVGPDKGGSWRVLKL